MSWSALPLACLPLVWLIPQHYLPWLAAHHDFAALALLCLAGLLVAQGQAIPRAWAFAVGIAVASAALQYVAGLIAFGGDAWMTALYLLTFAGAIALGQAIGGAKAGHGKVPDLLALGTVVAGVISVGIALVQWTGSGSLPLPVNFLASGDRPYGNFAQANNFCTGLFLGLCALCWLRESQRIGTACWALAAALLLFGMAMSGSRTGWLQMMVAAGFITWAGRRTPQRQLRMAHVLALLATLAALTLAWPAFTEMLLLAGGRDLADQAQVGLRTLIWPMAIDAISQRPWLGYGWQQIPFAQWAVALEHASLQRYIDSGHNLVLDLVLWAGLPVGALITALVGWALYRQARSIDDPRALWLFAGVLGFFVHAMLEMPHAYAYLLMPVGVALGIVHALCPALPLVSLRPSVARVSWAVMAVAVAITATDYLKVELNYRTARLESTFGERRITTPPPEIHALSQLGAFMELIRFEAKPGMTDSEIDALRTVSLRYAHPPALLRLALAEGLNGRPREARDTLGRLCAMHIPARCEDARAWWAEQQRQHPHLEAFPAPSVPPAR